MARKKSVEGVRLALAGHQALFRRGDRLVELTRAVLGDAERVEVDRPLRRSALASSCLLAGRRKEISNEAPPQTDEM
jgi:hypothetical protein